MRVLIAEDDPVSRRVLEATLEKWECEVVVCSHGDEAWAAMQADSAPRLVILDWMMPGADGPELCRRVRDMEGGQAFYILLLTAKSQKDDVVSGLDAGADDYLTKPFHREELRARISTGQRILDLQDSLAQRVTDLEAALAEVKELSGLLPICAYCKRIREGDHYWQAVEEFVAHHTRAQFSHGVCPDCYEKFVQPDLEKLQD